MNEKRPLILISNDDGYHAKGINSLVDMLADVADVIVCAPESARSGFATAFTANDPLRLKLRREREGMTMWSCTGTPVDCVKLALDRLFHGRRPDMIIGGINHGDNASVNVHYSGTMGIALEGCMKYIPSVAFSLADTAADADFTPLRPYVRSIVRRVLRDGLPEGVCLNVNFPKAAPYRGVKVCRMARGTWFNECVANTHPRGYEYFWMTGRYRNDEPEATDTDNWALTHGYVAITPTQTDVTAYAAMERLRAWEKGLDETTEQNASL